jgi:hypothetical protein
VAAFQVQPKGDVVAFVIGGEFPHHLRARNAELVCDVLPMVPVDHRAVLVDGDRYEDAVDGDVVAQRS